MVNVTKGILVECDPAMKQFLLHLDEKFLLGSKFIIQDLDDTHLFISADVLDMLKSQIDDLMDKISVPIVEGKEALKNWFVHQLKSWIVISLGKRSEICICEVMGSKSDLLLPIYPIM